MNLQKVRFQDGNLVMDVNVSSNGIIWLSLRDICLLFNKDKSNMLKLINKILKTKEANSFPTVVNFTTMLLNERSHLVKYYNLDVVKEIGFRVKSNRALLLENQVNEFSEINQVRSNDIIIYDNGNMKIDVKISPFEDTVWLNQNQIAKLFDTTQQNISFHIKNIVNEAEVGWEKSHKHFLYDVGDGRSFSVEFYNLDIILAVGYRVKSKVAIDFRRWATSTLKQYLLKGYALSKERVLVTQENYEYLCHEVSSLRKDVNELEKIIEGPSYIEKVIYDGETYDGYAYINSLIKKAKKSVTLIDGYADDSVFSFFQGVNKVITKTIVCHKSERFSKEIIDRFVNQYGEVKITTDKRFHDRFLIIDDDIYHLGSSLNNLGKKLVAVVKFEQLKKEALLKLVKE